MNGLLLIILLLTVCSVVAGAVVGTMYKKKVTTRKIDTWFTGAQPYLLLSFLILFIVAVTWSTFYYSKDFLPYPVSEHGRKIVLLFNTTTLFTGVAFFLTQILLFFFAFYG